MHLYFIFLPLQVDDDEHIFMMFVSQVNLCFFSTMCHNYRLLNYESDAMYAPNTF